MESCWWINNKPFWLKFKIWRPGNRKAKNSLLIVFVQLQTLYLSAWINVWQVPDIVSDSLKFVPVTPSSWRSSVYDILLKFENLPVIVIGRKRILSVKHEIVPDSDLWPAVSSCTVSKTKFGSLTWSLFHTKMKILSLKCNFAYIFKYPLHIIKVRSDRI